MAANIFVIRPTQLLRLLVMASVLALAACGGGSGGGDDSAKASVPARIEITPSAVLLTAPGQSKTLSARVFDADDQLIEASVQWASSRPEQMAVDANGVLRATGAGGSSQITARIGALQSPPLLAVHTALPAGAVLLTDANIVGQPVESTPDAAASLGNTYTVQLTGMAAPALGDLLINTEGKVVAGRVTAVDSIGGDHRVTLALVPAREMFPNLEIREVFDLNQAEVVIPEALLAMYTVQKNGNTYTFTAKPDAQVQGRALPRSDTRLRAQATAGVEFKRGPFTCKPAFDGAAGAGSEILALAGPTPLFAFTLNNSLDVLFTKAHGLERFVLGAKPNFSVQAGLTVLVAVEGKVTCEVELLVIKIPVGGPVALVIGGQLPVGVGMELAGKLTVVNMGISAKASAKTTVNLGLSCPQGAECAVVSEVGPLDLNFEPTVDGPSLNDLRLEPSLSTYAFVKAAIGNPFLKSLRFDAFRIKAGAALKGSFAPQFVQMGDAAYKSDYKLLAEIKAGVDTDFLDLAAFLGLNAVAETLAEINTEIGSSPAGTVTADRPTFVAGDTVNFQVKLDPSKVGFLPLIGPYNVKRILLVRNGDLVTAREVARVLAAPGQTDFDIAFTATNAGRADEFFAFVDTVLPLDLVSLELGQVQSTGDCVPKAGQAYCYTVQELPHVESNFTPLGMNARGEVLFQKHNLSSALQGACTGSDAPAQASCGVVWKTGAVRELPHRFLPVGIADDGTVGGNQLEGATYYQSITHPAVVLSSGQPSVILARSTPRSGNTPDADGKTLVSLSAGGRATYIAGDNGYSYSGADLGYCDMSIRYCRRWVYHESLGPGWGAGLEIRRDQLPGSGTLFGNIFDGDAAGRVGSASLYSSNDSAGMKDFQIGVVGRVNVSVDSLGTVLFFSHRPSDYSQVFELDPPSPHALVGAQPYALGRNGHALFCSEADALSGARRVRVVNVHTGEQGPEIAQSHSLTLAGHTIDVSIPCRQSQGNWIDPQGRMLAFASSTTNPNVVSVILTPRGQALP
ncbi:hypothetical protein [Hydrogenophaga sp.]|uniref:Ig-like domain-containing protein n=1 Tax=Hydrogenophaga sp. TaxID=1904254 RepID=UPI0035621AFC